MKGLKITVEDLETGETDSREIEPGDYCIVTCAPRYLSGEVHHRNGTSVLTLKRASDEPAR